MAQKQMVFKKKKAPLTPVVCYLSRIWSFGLRFSELSSFWSMQIRFPQNGNIVPYPKIRAVFNVASSTSFSKKAASLPKIAKFLWYLTEDLKLLGLFNRSVGLTTKWAMVKISKR